MEDFKISADHLGTTLSKAFAGWVFPHGGKSLINSNLRIIIRQQFKEEDHPDTPFEQIQKAIKISNACECGPNNESGLAMLYKGLREIKSDYAMVEALCISVSGSDFQPASYYLEHFLCPTERFAGMMNECETIVKDKAKYLNEKPERRRNIERFNLLAYAKQNKTHGVNTANLVQSHAILHLSSADAGLKFKDRQAAKMAVDKRERTILTIVESIIS